MSSIMWSYHRAIAEAFILALILGLRALPVGAADSGKYFASVPAVGGCSPKVTAAVAARSGVECASLSSRADVWRSFNFARGICVLSTSEDCAAPYASKVFRKLDDSSDDAAAASPTPPTAPPSPYGHELQIGARRFWVFQHRKTGEVDFARNWTEYETGFGDVNEFWSGLRALNSITASPKGATLRIEMTAQDGTDFVAEWSNFVVGGAGVNYAMNYGQYLEGSSNVPGDTLSLHKGMQFSTYDRDNDRLAGSCSKKYMDAGFWFNSCTMFMPTGLYSSTDMRSAIYVSSAFIYPEGPYSTLRKVRMMVQL